MTDLLIVDRYEAYHRGEGPHPDATVCGLTDERDLSSYFGADGLDDVGHRPACAVCFPDGIEGADVFRTMEEWDAALPPYAGPPAPTAEEQYAKLVAAVRVLITGQEVVWGDDGELAPGGLLRNWVDVFAPAVCDPLRWHWAWIVVPPGEEPSWEDVVEPPDAWDGSVPLWRPQTVSEALRRWCQEHAGRGDLVFRHDPDLRSSLWHELQRRPR